MIKLELAPEKFLEILSKGYSLDIIYLLKMIDNGYIPEEVNSSKSVKLDAMTQTILRKNLATDDYKVTITGKELLDFISSSSETKIKRKSKEVDGFEKWWKEFPGTDTFEYKGRKFAGTRALKTKKEDCKAKIAKYLNEDKDLTIDMLVEALKLDISQKKENSHKTGQNKLSYLQNSFTYLHQRSFEGYLDLIKAGHKPVTEIRNIYGGVSI